MLVLAHRGLHHDVPENTMESFERAVAAGVDGIEIDIRLSKDRLPIVFHDPRVGRRKVSAMTRAALSRAVGYHVPTLDEALARFDVLWDVEIKSPDATGATIRVLKKWAGRRCYFVTSFRRDILMRVHASLDAERGRILSRAPLGVGPALGQLVVWRFQLANVRRIQRAHRRKQRVFVYGMRSARQHGRCVTLGVDGVITDWPDIARLAIANPATPRAPRREGGRS